MSFSGGILTSAAPEYTVRFKFVDEHGCEKTTRTSQTYSLEQLIYFEKHSDDLYASVQDGKIIIDNIDGIESASPDEKLDFILKHNENRKASVRNGFFAIAAEVAFVVLLALIALLFPRFLNKIKMIIPAIYMVCLALTMFCIRILRKTISNQVIRRKGNRCVADIVEFYDDRAVFNQRIHKWKNQINRNSTHEFSFIQYSIEVDGTVKLFDEVLKPRVYVALFGLNKVPVFIYNGRACIDEDRLYIFKFASKGMIP